VAALKPSDIPSEPAGARFLVTGGAGFLGKRIVNELVKLNCDVAVLDLPEALASAGLSQSSRLSMTGSSLLDSTALRAAVKDKDYIVHLAAISDVGRAFRDPAEAFSVNCLGTQNLLEAVRTSGSDPFFMLSSSFVIYKSPPDYSPIDEAHPIAPSNPYGYSKACQDQMVDVYGKIYGLREARLRLSPFFGPGQRETNILLFLMKAMRNEDILIEGGRQSRDWNYVDNVVSAFVEVARRNRSGALNIGGGKEISVNGVVSAVLRLTRSRSRVIRNPYRPGESSRTRVLLDTTRAKRQIGYSPRVSFEEGLRLLYADVNKSLPSR
jgi:UDP-glucose 4-epimerase